MSLADTIFLFQSERIIQERPPAEIYRKPINHYVAEFLGKANIFSIIRATNNGIAELRSADGQFAIATGEAGPHGEAGQLFPFPVFRCSALQGIGVDKAIIFCYFKGLYILIEVPSAFPNTAPPVICAVCRENGRSADSLDTDCVHSPQDNNIK